MTTLAYRPYIEGSNLAVVAFPTPAGDAELKHTQSLDSLGLALEDGCEPLPQKDIPYGTFNVARRKDLVDGGLRLVVNYEAERLRLTPISPRTGDTITGKTMRYLFSDLCLVDARTSDIQLAKDEARVTIRKDPLPRKEGTWP